MKSHTCSLSGNFVILVETLKNKSLNSASSPNFCTVYLLFQKLVILLSISKSHPASSSTVLFIYYGKSDATTASNGTATFILFDDFDSLSADWTVEREMEVQSPFQADRRRLEAEDQAAPRDCQYCPPISLSVAPVHLLKIHPGESATECSSSTSQA